MIADFYENCEIFITGGSGVVGKAAIEKLLRSCNVKKIYILMRCKRGVDPESRLVDMKKAKIFDVLKKCKPNELDKLVAIPGDISLECLGISPEHKELIKNVKVFIHSGASTSFAEPLKKAISFNVKSTLEALKLAETLENLKIFVHVSTFFSNPYLKKIEEKIYPPLFDWRTAIKLVDLDDTDPTLEIITQKVINGFPNTYLFTKHLAEQLVNEWRFKLPVAIFKPSIVITSIEEPQPGFTESMTGIMGMMAVWGTGLVQAFFLGHQGMTLDLTPLDYGTKVLLIFTAMKGQLPRERFIEATPVTNFSSYELMKTPFIEYCHILTKSVHKFPYEKCFWIPNVTVTTCSYYYWLIVVFLQIMPSFIVDNILRLFGIKPFMMHIQRKLHHARKALIFFLVNQYESNGITDLDAMIKVADGSEFSIGSMWFHLEKNQSTAAIDNIAKGCRKFLLNEPDSSFKRSRRILTAKIIVYNILRAYVAFVVFRIIYRTVMSYMDK